MDISAVAFELNGVNYHVAAAGPQTAQPVILLHGFPELALSWRDVMRGLAQAGFRALAPDLRGYGATEKPATGYDIATLADDVVALIDHVGGLAHVVGHDWGGAIAFEVAARHPDRLMSLTAINAPHPEVMAQRVWQPDQLLRSWYMLFFQLPWLPERYVAQDHGRQVMARMRAGAVRKDNFSQDRLAPFAAAFATPALARPPIEYYRAAFRGLFVGRPGPRPKAYPKIQAPFRLIWSLRDRALGPALTRGLEPYFVQKPDIVYLTDVGHSAPIEAPERITALVLEHLRRGDAQSNEDSA